jgi:hypothetical protein
LSIADDVTAERILPAIHEVRADFGVVTKDYAITAAQADYRVPSRAAFGVVREVSIIDANGVNGTDLPLATVEEMVRYGGSGTPVRHVIEGDRIVLLPTPAATTGTLRVKYYRRPSALVAASTSADEQPHAITSGATTTQITIGTHAFDQTGETIDIVQAKPPFDVLAMDVPVTTVDATTVSIGTAVTTAAVGDYICGPGETPIPQLQAELHPVLAIGAAAEVLRRVKDGQANAREAEFMAKLSAVVSAMAPRNHGETPRVVNHYSALRYGMRRWWPES